MKKLLSMVLAMMLAFASMGVLAAGEAPAGNNTTLVWAWDFEEENVGLVGSKDYPNTQVRTTFPNAAGYTDTLLWEMSSANEGHVVSNGEIEGTTAASGTRMMQIVEKTSLQEFGLSTKSLIPLEKDAWYKFSYKYAVDSASPAYIKLGISEMENITSKNWSKDALASSFETFYRSGGNTWAAWQGSPQFNVKNDDAGEGVCATEKYTACAKCEAELGTPIPEKCAACGETLIQEGAAIEGATVEKTRYTIMAWNTYEVYFRSKNVDTQHLLITLGAGKSARAFFDDLKLEKINGSTAVNFSTGNVRTSDYLTLITGTGEVPARNKGVSIGRTVDKSEDGIDIISYPFCTLRKPALEMNGTKVRVSVAHVPKTTEETITLLIGQFRDENGAEQLLNVWSTPLTYTAATKTAEDTTTVTEYYYAEESVKTNAYELTGLENVTDSYLQAFVFDEVSGLRPVGGKTVLAPAAATPAA